MSCDESGAKMTTRFRDASGAYKFLRIEETETKHGKYKHAVCLNHASGKEITFNDKLFEKILPGSNVTFNHNLKYPEGVVVITEDQIQPILADDARAHQAMLDEAERVKQANIATGRFKYYYTDFRQGKAENIEEFLTNKREDFMQTVVDILNEGSRMMGKPRETKLTVEQMSKDERLMEFMKLYEPGDELVWYSWNGGFLAYSAGPALRRGGNLVAALPWIVS